MLTLQRGDARVAVYFLTALVILSVLSSSTYAASVKASKGIGSGSVLYPVDLMLEKVSLAFSGSEKKPSLALAYATEHLTEAEEAVAGRKSSAVVRAVTASKERYAYASAHISGFAFSGSEDDKSTLESFAHVKSQLALSDKELVALQDVLAQEVASGTLDSSTLAEVDNLRSDHQTLELSREDKESEFVTKAYVTYGPVETQLIMEKAEEAAGAYSVFKEQTLPSLERARQDVDDAELAAQEFEVKGGIESAAKIRLLNQRALYFAQQSENSFNVGFYGEAHDASVRASQLASAARAVAAGKDIEIDSLVSSPLKQLQDERILSTTYVEGYQDHKDRLVSKYPDDIARVEKKVAIVAGAAKIAEQSEARYASDVARLRETGKTDEQIGVELSKQYSGEIRKAYGETTSVRVASSRGKNRIQSVPVQSGDSSSSSASSGAAGSSSSSSDSGASSGSSQSSSGSGSSNGGGTKSSPSSDQAIVGSSAVASEGVREIEPGVKGHIGPTGDVIKDHDVEESFIDTFRGWLRKQLGYQ